MENLTYVYVNASGVISIVVRINIDAKCIVRSKVRLAMYKQIAAIVVCISGIFGTGITAIVNINRSIALNERDRVAIEITYDRSRRSKDQINIIIIQVPVRASKGFCYESNLQCLAKLRWAGAGGEAQAFCRPITTVG